jgi:hypothetical protein
VVSNILIENKKNRQSGKPEPIYSFQDRLINALARNFRISRY